MIYEHHKPRRRHKCRSCQLLFWTLLLNSNVQKTKVKISHTIFESKTVKSTLFDGWGWECKSPAPSFGWRSGGERATEQPRLPGGGGLPAGVHRAGPLLRGRPQRAALGLWGAPHHGAADTKQTQAEMCQYACFFSHQYVEFHFMNLLIFLTHVGKEKG